MDADTEISKGVRNMRMRPEVHIWAGVKVDDYDFDVIKEKLPEFYLEKDEYGDLSEDETRWEPLLGENKAPELVYCCGSLIGFGLLVLDHDWDFGAIEVDLSKMSEKASQYKAAMEKLFKSCRIDLPVKVYCQTDCLFPGANQNG